MPHFQMLPFSAIHHQKSSSLPYLPDTGGGDTTAATTDDTSADANQDEVPGTYCKLIWKVL